MLNQFDIQCINNCKKSNLYLTNADSTSNGYFAAYGDDKSFIRYVKDKSKRFPPF